MPCPGPAETLSYAAACTERLRLGCAAFVTPLHSPVQLAKTISSLDQLSRGRVEVSVGIGGRSRMFPAFGLDDDARRAQQRTGDGLNDLYGYLGAQGHRAGRGGRPPG